MARKADRTGLKTPWRTGMALVLALATVLAFRGLADGGLRDGDEARYALVAENMLHQPDPLTMYYQGQPYFWKSPLRIWITAATFRVAGINPWTIRFWSAVAGVLTVWLTCLLGRNLFGRRAGLLAGLALATMPGFLHVHGARTGEMDTALAAFMLLALLPSTRAARRGDLILSAVALAGVGLVKHLTLVPVVGLLLAAGYGVLGRWRGVTGRELVAAAGVLAALLLPWFIVQAIQHPQGLTHAYFGSVISQTTVSSPDPDPGPWYFLGVILSGAWPWVGVAVISAPLLVMGAPREDRRALLPFVWLAIYLVIISAAGRKLPWYALPAYPLLALPAGAAVGAWRDRARGTGRAAAVCTLLVLALGAWLAGVHTAGFADRPGYKVVMDGSFLARGLAGWKGLLLVGVALVCGGATAWSRKVARQGRLTEGVGLLGLVLLAAFALIASWTPLKHPYPGDWDRALQAVRMAGHAPGQVLVVMPPAKWRDDVRNYYVRRLTGGKGETSPGEAAARLRDGGFSGVVVTRADSRGQLEAFLRRQAPGAGFTMEAAAGKLVVLKVKRSG